LGLLLVPDRYVEDQSTARHRTNHGAIVVPERLAQFKHTLGDGIVGDHDAGPHRDQQLLARHQTAGMLEQVQKHGEGFWPHGDLLAAARK
jgi:hypothetical protein